MLLIKVLLVKKASYIDFWFSKNEEITLPPEFIFVFIWYFYGAILLEKSCQKGRGRGGHKNKGGWPYRGLSIEKSFKPSAHYVNPLLVMMKVELEYKKHNFRILQVLRILVSFVNNKSLSNLCKKGN